MWRASLALLAGRLDEARDSSGAAPSSAGSRTTTTRAAVRDRSGSRSTRRGRFAADDAEIVARRLAHLAARGPAGSLALTVHRYTGGDRAAAREASRAGVTDVRDAEPDANWLYAMTALGVLAARFGDAPRRRSLSAWRRTGTGS